MAIQAIVAGCRRQPPATIVVYCGVDEPYARQVFADFEQQTGIHISPVYDVESSKSVGLAGKLEAERAHPLADVWWGSEAFLSVRLADEGVLERYTPSGADEVPAAYKDPDGYWTGVGLRARVLAVGEPPPSFAITGIRDLLDPRLKGKIALSRPSAGATGAHVAALYTIWGEQRAREFFRQLHANGAAMVGGNAVVADQVGAGSYVLGLTDSDDVTNAAADGAKITMVVPDQAGEGTLAMPTTVGLVHGAVHPAESKRLIDFLISKQVERKLIDMKFARWSVRPGGGPTLKALNVDVRQAARVYARAQREVTAILEGHEGQD